ncbi:segregation and condensation protein A [Legionella rubrilucens]|uniref:Segregation and condensation protein A n=1 Tax=Legionella rubrilucens TaxID=458 RepID=A0A0W0XXG9_9GAMM|nr:ScpA family protein [Legionella rubrilucens]KTD49447.1 segregation and condensation protein A [Legionella rubrilucens]
MDPILADNPAPALALVSGKPFTEMPPDLFIPPDALEVLLDSFSGPLDLLLYLIRRQNIDILDIPIAHITRQYMQYIQLIETTRLELAADYLVMAAMLAEIKSRCLLPPTPNAGDEPEEDPRMALVRRLKAYEEMKMAAESLDELPRCERDYFRVEIQATGLAVMTIHPDVELSLLPEMMRQLAEKQGHQSNHQISREQLSVRERMTMVLERLSQEKTLLFTRLFSTAEGRMGLTVTLLAVLELARQSLVIINQGALYGPIHIMAVDHG